MEALFKKLALDDIGAKRAILKELRQEEKDYSVEELVELLYTWTRNYCRGKTEEVKAFVLSW